MRDIEAEAKGSESTVVLLLPRCEVWLFHRGYCNYSILVLSSAKVLVVKERKNGMDCGHGEMKEVG